MSGNNISIAVLHAARCTLHAARCTLHAARGWLLACGRHFKSRENLCENRAIEAVSAVKWKSQTGYAESFETRLFLREPRFRQEFIG